ncbi:MAG: MBL fold metallo-hydrolase, partial [Pseudomonadota bacterium]
MTPASQSSLAVSAGDGWALLNCSPDIRQQIMATPALHPREGRLRDTPIRSILLTNGDIDHIAGLLILREKQAYRLLMTAEITKVIAENPIFNALDPDFVTREVVALETPVELTPGLTATLFAVPGKVPLFMEGDHGGDAVKTDLMGEQTVGVELTASGKTAFYIPGCARMVPALAERIRGAELLFFDGTVWTD